MSTATDTSIVDMKKVEEFAGKVMTDFGGALALLLSFIGDQTGVFRALRDGGRMGVGALAKAAGVDARYLREWLGAQTAAGYVNYHAEDETFSLSPEQAVVLNITDRQAEYAKSVSQNLENQGFRVKSDLRNEKIGFKIREHTIQRVPYLLVVGDREMDSNTVAVRTRSGEDLGSLSQQAFADRLAAEIASHGRHISGGA